LNQLLNSFAIRKDPKQEVPEFFRTPNAGIGMVQVRQNYIEKADGSVDFKDWLQRLEMHVLLSQHAQIEKAFNLSWGLEKEAHKAEQTWPPTISRYRTGLEMAYILAQLHLDSEAIIAAILYRPVRESRLSLTTITQEFSKSISSLVEGVLRMAAINEINTSRTRVLGQNRAQLENVRKMLLAMVDDVRVALIKLAERTCAIRAAKQATEEKRQRVAREVFDIYAPLAHRLGIGQIKWELEDLSFRYLQEESYKRIASLIDERRVDREQFIRQVSIELRKQLGSANIDAEVSGRAKSIYSIWRKMQNKKLDFSQIFDIRAVRILVPEIRDCYATLGIVHSLWPAIPNEFDDYIATPKENGYQSLHTAVIGPDKKVLEIQIRTFAMDEDAELGVCAHWRYKDDSSDPSQKDSYDEKIAWLRQVLAWHDEMGMAGGLAEQLRSDTAMHDRIYVFTPEGHVVDLMHGATPLDFAYYVHTEVGHSCVGAKVNGRDVPLYYQLQTGDRVEIFPRTGSSPKRIWLKHSQGYANTPRARAKLVQWFKDQSKDENINYGESLLRSELTALGINDINYRSLIRKLGCKNLKSLFASVGAGAIQLDEVIQAVQELTGLKTTTVQALDNPPPVHGAGSLKIRMAECCTPLPGDLITGRVQEGEVMIHQTACQQVLDTQRSAGINFIEVNWSQGVKITFPVELLVTAWDRPGLLRDITTVLANDQIQVIEVNAHSNRTAGTTYINLQIEIESFPLLFKVLEKINYLNNVIEAKRKMSGQPVDANRTLY
jgi:GTP pyrophosphokinase